MIENIFIVLTPFHYKMMSELFPEKMKLPSSLFFYSKNAGIDTTNSEAQFERIPDFIFSIGKLKKAPFSTSRTYKKEIKKIQDHCEDLLSSKYTLHKKIDLIIGTDKDNFTQILLNKLYRDQQLVIFTQAIEEGIGFYLKETWSDKLMVWAYKMFTPLLFGERIQYHKQLGTDKRIDRLYVRLPHLLPAHPNLDTKEIIKIASNGQENNTTLESGNKVLIYSFPNEDYQIDDLKKKAIFEGLLSRFSDEEEIYVKPHPRESVQIFLSMKSVKLIDNSQVGENLDYFEYQKIVNFSSSIIIDLLAKNYPKEHIYTVVMKKKSFPLFEETQCIELTALKNVKA